MLSIVRFAAATARWTRSRSGTFCLSIYEQGRLARMTVRPATAQTAPAPTHEVFNQPPPLEDFDVFSTNVPLVEATQREGAGWVLERASALGRIVGGEPLHCGFAANENAPTLQTHDRLGHRIDEVEAHPAWPSLTPPRV